LNSWSFSGAFVDYNGVTAAASALANPTMNDEPYTNDLMNVTAELTMFTPADDPKGILNAPTASNHCWTAVHFDPIATDT